MQSSVQLSLFEKQTTSSSITKRKTSEWGTFKDSLRAPIHRWFTYPAGFSYKAVEYSLNKYQISPGQTIYDPFMGSGTTNLVAKTRGIDSFGVEAHPFVYRIAQTKMNWNITREEVLSVIKDVRLVFQNTTHTMPDTTSIVLEEQFPELILKCYETDTLRDLFILRQTILTYDMSPELRNFFFVVVTALLREISTAATGWPYIAPNKKKVTSSNKDVFTEFAIIARRMVDDVDKIKEMSQGRYKNSRHRLINGDSRNTKLHITEESMDHVFTSPPYLNNFDYADRTRLELYFWGEASTWGEISEQVRTKLITSATTQIARSDPKYDISDEIRKDCPDVTKFIETSICQLSDLRKTKGGKKSYDLLVAGYFNDMHLIVKDVYRVLKPGTKALFVLGDSAPYGVHIPTDDLIGQIGLGVGFDTYEIDILRTRGEKWKANPQRHSVALRESIVILSKE